MITSMIAGVLLVLALVSALMFLCQALIMAGFAASGKVTKVKVKNYYNITALVFGVASVVVYCL